MGRFRLQNPVPVLDVGGHGREPSLSLLFCHMNQVIPCTWGVERRGEFSPLGPLAGCFLALGSGLGLVGTVSTRR